MSGGTFLGSVVLGGLILCCSAAAQVPQDVREKLTPRDVIIRADYIYAMSAGAIRGSIETSEQLQVTRAMRSIAHTLCDFQPLVGKRLETGIVGVTLVASTTRGKEIEVVIRAPIQKPVCKVLLTTPPSDLPGPEVGVTHAFSQRPTEEAQTRLTEPGYSRSQDIVIRIFGGEY